MTNSKKERRRRTTSAGLLGIAVMTVAASVTSLPLHLQQHETSGGGSFFALAADSSSSSSSSNRSRLRSNHSIGTNRHHRRGEAAAADVSSFPQPIVRLPLPSPRGINHGGPKKPPTPAPVAARPTPAPVGNTKEVDMNQQSTTVEGDPLPYETVSPYDPVPWADVYEPEVEVEVEVEAPATEEESEETFSSGDKDTSSNGEAANNGNENEDTSTSGGEETEVNGEDETSTNGDEPIADNRDACEVIREQDHSEMLEKEQAGKAGPSFLYSVTVSVVHDEALLAAKDIPGVLDSLNVPVALSVAGCQVPSDRRALTISTSDITRKLQSESQVEYTELENWREFTTASINDGCDSSQQTEGTACGNYRTRIIVFLVDGERTYERQEEFQDKTDQALQTHRAVVTDNPGIRSMTVQSIAPVGLSPIEEPEGLTTDTTTVASATGSSNSSSALLSDREKVIVGAVGAGVGGLLIGMMCLLYCRKSSRWNNYRKHSRFDDDSNDNENSDEWSPPKKLPPSHTTGPFPKETVSSFPSFRKLQDTSDIFDEEELTRNISLTHRGDSYRSTRINRVNSLLDNPKPRRQQPQGTSVELRRAATLENMRTAPTVSWSFDDEFIGDEDEQEEPESNLFCTPEKPCSSATCELCEDHRASGLDRGEYLWLKEIQPPSPQRFDPARDCFCSDTVEL